MNYGDHNYVANRACRARRVEPVELDVSSESSCALRLARHSQIALARHVERVESRRAKWNLGYRVSAHIYVFLPGNLATI